MERKYVLLTLLVMNKYIDFYLMKLALPESRFTPQDIRMINDYHGLKQEQQKRLIAYMEALKKIESLEEILI